MPPTDSRLAKSTGTGACDGPAVAEHHLRELHASAIPDDVIAQEGISTVTTRAEIMRLGYSEPWQQLVPAIKYTVRPPDGSKRLYVIKPDHPRARKDKPGKYVKYEWPHGKPHRLDIVGDLADLRDPAVDLYLVEGKKKALSIFAQMRNRGQRCVIVVVWGVWAWGKKPDDHSRCELIADWDLIALEGRRVFVVFDSDRDEKENVDLAARQIASRLAERGAEVYHVKLPSEPDGSKNGADDLIARHGFEVFDQCVEEAIDRGPHGTEALRAAFRRERAENQDLKKRLAATAALMEVPTAQLESGDKAVLWTAAAELSKRAADEGSTDGRPFVLETMAKRAGLSDQVYGRRLDRFCKGETRLFDKKRRPLNPDDPSDKRRVIYLRPTREECSTFEGILWAGISIAKDIANAWGGKKPPRPIPPCPLGHSDQHVAYRVSQIVCGAPRDDGNICGEPRGEPSTRVVPRPDRNTQVECSTTDEGGGPTPSNVSIRTQVECSDRVATRRSVCRRCGRALDVHGPGDPVCGRLFELVEVAS